MARSRSYISVLLVAVIALIAYGSLYPFNFKPDAINGGVLEALRQLVPGFAANPELPA